MVIYVIIVIGGAFNPPTLAHYEMMQSLKARYPIARIILLPVGNYYPKPELIAFEHRFKMLELMVQSLNYVTVSDMENTDKFKGTYDSLNHIKADNQTQDIYFAIGSDHLDTIDQWINYKLLLSTYPFIVLNRKGYMDLNKAEEKYEHIDHQFIPVDFDEPISSTMIRQNINAHKQHLHKDVYQYIMTHKLYQKET